MRDVEGIVRRLGAFLDERAGGSHERVLAVRSPARSEIAGNHTDHEGGRVIAAALDRSIECLAVANGTDTIRVFSRGFEPVSVVLDELSPRADEQVTSTGLVRGMAAQMAQRVERDWFGKPCGLMDQLAVSLGGLSHMDFEHEQPRAERLTLDFADHGLALTLTDVGCDHSAYTNEYAAVPAEMRAVAQALGGERLADVREESLYLRLEELRAHLGDRMVLRALHYWQEMELVDARWEALCTGDLGRFLLLTERSGASSAMFLQNVSVGGSVRQDAMVALALSTRLLHGRGATRIHGGGFGGSIQAFVPVEELDAYRMSMDRLLGDGACKAYRISTEGAQAQWL